MLQEPDIQVNIQSTGYDKYTLLHLAVMYTSGNILDIIRALLSKGADANIQDRAGNTPLHVAIAMHNLAAFQELLKFPGIRLNLRNRDGRTPLHEAILAHDKDLVHELANAPDIKFNIRDDCKMTPLDLAFYVLGFHEPESRAAREDIVKLLQEAPVQQARQHSRAEALQLFYALKKRPGAKSPAKTLTPDVIRQIQQMLEQEKIREATEDREQ